MFANPDGVAVFGAVFAALYAAHQVADHWVQTQHQADHKGLPGTEGRISCLLHVLTYTATALVAILAMAAVTGWQTHPVPLLAGLVVSAVTHYVADRRTPLRRMADWLGKSPAWLDKGNGMYAMDQSWHIGWLFIAALVVTA